LEQGAAVIAKVLTKRGIPEPTLRRLPVYHHLLQRLETEGSRFVSCSRIGAELDLDPTQVRKDFEMAGVEGRPKVGFLVAELVPAIEETLGWRNVNEAFLAGAGNLGAALLGYPRFQELGLNIVAAFDADPSKVGVGVHGRPVLPLDKLTDLARRMRVHIGILTVPAAAAQDVADRMVQGGILALWNFAPVTLRVPPDVIVQNEELYYGLAALSRRLAQRLDVPIPTGD
jgi:redox-sensing transcriptional repressor